jgi:hypothetical protein
MEPMTRLFRIRRTTVVWLAALAFVLGVPAAAGLAARPASDSAGGSPGRAISAPVPGAPAASETADRSIAAAVASGAGSASAAPGAPSTDALAPVTTGLIPGAVNRTSLNLSVEYQAAVRLSFANRYFRVASTLTVTNTSGGPIDRLELNTIAARLGGMRITLARSDGRAVAPTVSDQTIRVPLGGTLPAGGTVTVRLDYVATLRGDTAGSNWLFARANGIIAAHRWLPWVSRPTAFNRPNHGDPFVTPASPRVRVTITADRTIRWATTGEQTGATGFTTSFEASNVRDFVITGAPDYRTASATVGGVVVRVWYRAGFPASTVLAAARTALAREASLLGPYPYRTYDIAQTGGGYGMEAPGLTWIPTGAGNLGYLVAHETAHQWFYGIAGNDQARQPYADEAAADFVARSVLGLRRGSRCAAARLDLTIYQYSSTCYYEVVYIQGGNFLDDTRRAMGSTAFWAGMRDYLATYRFGIGSTKALLDTLDRHTPLSLVPRYEPRFPGLY